MRTDGGRRPRGAFTAAVLVVVIVGTLLLSAAPPAAAHAVGPSDPRSGPAVAGATNATQQFAAALNRLVTLVAAAGGALLALVWARVALSWFSNDVAKKVQAKERARDALIGSLVFTAAISGLVWALAQWVVTGT